jgi:ribosomal-protein-alanine N-acetyltransferase
MSRADRARIVPASVRHADDLARLHASLFDAAWDAASFKELLAHSGAVAFVARAGNPREIVGFIIGRQAADEAEILTLGVARNWQRLGVGRLLVQTFARAALARPARVNGHLKETLEQGGKEALLAAMSCRLYLEVAAGNVAARALYDRLGFQECGRRRGYYARADGVAEDAINLNLSFTFEQFIAWVRGGRP